MRINITSLACAAVAVAFCSHGTINAQEGSSRVAAGSGYIIDPDNPTQKLPPIRGTQTQDPDGSQTPQQTQSPDANQNTSTNGNAGNMQQGAQFGQSFSLARMIGVGIQGNDGQTLGSIQDVIFDSTGRIRYLAASRNLQGQNGQRILLPRQAFDLSQPMQMNSTGDGFSVSVNLNQEQFNQAPSFMQQQLTATSGPTPLFNQVDQFYGIDENTTQGGMNGMNRMNAMTRNGMPQGMNGQQFNNGQQVDANGQTNISGRSSTALGNRNGAGTTANSSTDAALQNRNNQSANGQNPANGNNQAQMNRNRNGAQNNNPQTRNDTVGNRGANQANPGLQNQVNNANRGAGNAPINGVNVPGASTPGTGVNTPGAGTPGTLVTPPGGGGNIPARGGIEATPSSGAAPGAGAAAGGGAGAAATGGK